VASADVGQNLGTGPSGPSKVTVRADHGLNGMGCSIGLIAEVGLEASNGVVPNKEMRAP
jgi:hypothetical protein